MFDPRTWMFNVVSSMSSVTALVGDRIYSTLEETPAEKPFIVIRLDGPAREAAVGILIDVFIWVHDKPESYTNIDEILGLLRDELDGKQVLQPEGIGCHWNGDSPDLADDARKTVVKYGSFRIAGRR